MRWLWWLLGLGAAGGVGYYLISSSTGEKVPAKTACVADLPESFRSQAQAARASGDVAKMTALAAQADTNGWTCAAGEIRAAISGGPGGPGRERPRTREGEKDSSSTSPAARATMNLRAVADSTSTPETLKGQTIAVLKLTTTPKSGAEVDYKTVWFEKKPTSDQIQSIDDLSAALSVAEYTLASGQATDMAGAARKAAEAVEKTAEPESSEILMSPEFGASLAPLGESTDPWAKKKEEAKVIADRGTVALTDVPSATIAEIATETGADWLASPPETWGGKPTFWQYSLAGDGSIEAVGNVRSVCNALWIRGFKTAANQLAAQFMKLQHPTDDAGKFADASYPV